MVWYHQKQLCCTLFPNHLKCLIVLHARHSSESSRVWKAFEVCRQVEFMYLLKICYSFLNTQLRQNPKYSLDFYAHLRLCGMSLRMYCNQFTSGAKYKFLWNGRKAVQNSRLFRQFLKKHKTCIDWCERRPNENIEPLKVRLFLLWLPVSYNRLHRLNFLNLHL